MIEASAIVEGLFADGFIKDDYSQGNIDTVLE